jgi:hypothetical protein
VNSAGRCVERNLQHVADRDREKRVLDVELARDGRKNFCVAVRSSR